MHDAQLPSSRTPIARKIVYAVALSLALESGVAIAAGTDAKGTIVYKGRTTAVKYAYLVTGPWSVTKEQTRRLILSSSDLGPKIAACKTFSCTDDDLRDGLQVNLGTGQRFEFWVVQNDQKVQFSGSEPVAALAAKVNDGKQLTGKIKFEQSAFGGLKVDVEFDAALAKALTAP